jgi:magnesium transporter
MAETVPPPHDTAGHHLVANVAVGHVEDTVAATFERLRGRSYACLENVHVVDPQERLLGVVPMTRLFAAPTNATLAAIMGPIGERLGPEVDQELLISWARRHDAPAPPIVDPDGRLMGCVPPAALIEIGRREHAEDISRLAGILHQNDLGRHALEAPPWRRALSRLPWLLVGLAGSIVATWIVAHFEERLSAHIAVAFFIPAIVYLADAVGTQTEAVVIRGLSFLHAPSFSRLFLGEVSAGMIVGGTLGAAALPLVYLGFGDARLAVAVAVAVAIAGSLATACGLIFPWVLSHYDQDPAFGSGPVATIIQDVLSLAIYFLIVQAIM